MKKTSLLLLLFTWTMQASAQYKTLDQLKKELDKHPQQDSFRVNRLNQLSFYNALSFAEREIIAAEALVIARKINYRRGEGIALTNLGYYRFRLGNRKEGDSLLQNAATFAKETGDPELMGVVHYRTGMAIRTTTGGKEALDYLLKAEAAFEKSNDHVLLADCQKVMADFYKDILSNYPLAMEYLLKAIQSAERSNYVFGQIDIFRSLGTLYSFIGDHTNALLYLKKAESEFKRTNGTPKQYSYLQNSLGEVYRLSGKYPEAIQAYNLAIESAPGPGSDYVNESNLADVYTRMDSLSLALQYGLKSLEGARQSENASIISWIHGILARAYLKKAMADTSIYYALSGLDMAIQAGTIEFMRDNAAALADAYAFKKDFGKAYSYHLRFINYRDSMLNAEVRNKTAVLQYNNDIEKKQAQIVRLNQEKKAQQSFMFSIVIVLTLILITAVLLLRNNRQKQKANKLLQRQKQEIDDKAHELSVQKDHLQQSYTNVELLSEIGRKITSSLSVEKIIATVYDNVNSFMDASVFGIGIYNHVLRRIEFPSTYEDGKALPDYYNDINDLNRFAPLCLNSGKEIIIGNLDNEYISYIQEVPIPHEGKQAVSLIYLPLVVKEKKLGVITVQSFEKNAYTEYHLFMLRNIAIYTAIALENAESYETLHHTVESLKSTQAQLIQSEKMASLGELTAGIAHEIQNPLNFVNNFSEVNAELIDEVKEELSKMNWQAASDIADAIKQNLEKISQHGRRADSIVKGMLQHSQSSTGVKEPTDVNALTDEYLRLAYHGLRARDKSFNAITKTEFDSNINKIKVVSQDIGRVLLNLVNNAYYTVSEKKKQKQNGYEPTVTVTTARVNGHIEIKVKDNGNGISQKILDKIFHPFFTTKPTGQGTGLGLSLAYDIITKGHGGQLRVNTKEGEGSEFIVQLPNKVN